MTTDGTLIYSSGRFPQGLFALQPQTGHIVWIRDAADPRGSDVDFVRWMVPLDGRVLTDFGVLGPRGKLLEAFGPRRPAGGDARKGVLVVAFRDGVVNRLNPGTFVPVWTARVDPFASCEVLTTESAVVVVGRTGAEFVDLEAHVSVLDPSSGTRLWTTVLRSTRDILSGALAADREHIYASHRESDRSGGTVIAYGARTGHVDWVQHLSTPGWSITVAPAGQLLYLWEGEGITALDRHTGAVRWHTRIVTAR